jgi:hypothetical protein
VKHGEKASAADLEEGDEVRASLSEQGGQIRVKKLEIVRGVESEASGASSQGAAGSSGTSKK